jgi:hypothetical protein
MELVPEPSEQMDWLALGRFLFRDWHVEGLKQYHEAGWTLQALADYRRVVHCGTASGFLDTASANARAPSVHPSSLSLRPQESMLSPT